MILPALSTLGQANLFCDLGIKNGNNPVPGLSIFVACKANNYHNIFLELLEQQQFPIDDSHQMVGLRSASDFACQLNIHVNYLNRAVKVTTEKTTSQLITERILQEAKILLKHSAWTVSEIAFALGFNEVTHFNNFFKKHAQLSPLKFRNVLIL